jgi:hypothetical protein
VPLNRSLEAFLEALERAMVSKIHIDEGWIAVPGGTSLPPLSG